MACKYLRSLRRIFFAKGNTKTMYQIVIIEPSEIIVEGIKQFLERHPNFQIKASFPNWQSFVNWCMRKEDFQIVIINPAVIQFHNSFNVRDLFGDYPGISIVALQTQYVTEKILSYFDVTINIYDEGLLLPNKLLRTIEIGGNKDVEKSLDMRLSNRENEVLIYLAKGLSNKEIASEMCLSLHTIISYRKTLTRKINIKTVSGLILYALANNLISLEILYLSHLPSFKTGYKRIKTH